MIWPFNRHEAPVARDADAEDERTESVIARKKKQNALSELVRALGNIEVERDLDELAQWPRKPKP